MKLGAHPERTSAVRGRGFVQCGHLADKRRVGSSDVDVRIGGGRG